MDDLQRTDVRLDSAAVEFLREIAKWAFFLSIMGFIGIAFMVIIAVFAGTIFSALGQYDGSMGNESFMTGGFITVLYLIIALLYFFPIYYLFKFASGLKEALRSNNSDSLTTSLGYLKSHYKFIGILTIVILSIYFLIFIVAIIGGIAMFT